MELHEEVRQLLLGARKDFRALSGMKDPHTFAEEIFGFHAQQAVEKSLKAWIQIHAQQGGQIGQGPAEGRFQLQEAKDQQSDQLALLFRRVRNSKSTFFSNRVR